jgi:hypothetical protein
MEHIDKRVDVAGRKRDDVRILKRICHHRGNQSIHRPSQIFAASGAEFSSGHEQHIPHLRQARDRIAFK